jgi:hypothetical protein
VFVDVDVDVEVGGILWWQQNGSVVVECWVGILGTPSVEDNTTPNDSPDSMIGDHGNKTVCETPSRKPLDRKSVKDTNYLDDETKLEGARSKK